VETSSAPRRDDASAASTNVVDNKLTHSTDQDEATPLNNGTGAHVIAEDQSTAAVVNVVMNIDGQTFTATK
jgi:hypothetical protein